MNIRAERPADIAGIRLVNLAAFESSAEADLVDALRKQAAPLVSVVADDGDAIVGHVMFSPVGLTGHPSTRIAGLGPMAVLPERQRQGIGSAMIRAGLGHCKQVGFSAVVVLGHAGYYPRFGFTPASRFGLGSVYDVPDDVFMAVELEEDALTGKAGMIHYHPAFADV